MVKVIGTIYHQEGTVGDFAWMIQQIDYSDALFVFNDNEEQFRHYRVYPQKIDGWGCSAGGGNAIIRPYQCKYPPRAAGIPTGPDYFQLTARISGLINEALNDIATIVEKHGYERIFYSAGNEGGLIGTGIFYVGQDVRKYITKKLLEFGRPSSR